MANVTRTEFRCDTADCGRTITIDGLDDHATRQAARDLGWDVANTCVNCPPGGGDHCPDHKPSREGQ